MAAQTAQPTAVSHIAHRAMAIIHILYHTAAAISIRSRDIMPVHAMNYAVIPSLVFHIAPLLALANLV